MREYVESTLNNMIAVNNQDRPNIWNHELSRYRSHNGLYMVNEIKENAALDLVAEYLRYFGHCVAVDRSQKTLYADYETVVVGTAETSSVERRDGYLVVNLAIELPAGVQKAIEDGKAAYAQHLKENAQLNEMKKQDRIAARKARRAWEVIEASHSRN